MINPSLLFLLLVGVGVSSAFVMPGGTIAKRTSDGPHEHTHTQQNSLGDITATASPTRMYASTPKSTAAIGRNLAVAGRIPWKKFLITKAQARKIVSIMRAETHTLDLVIVFILSAFPERIGEFVYEKLFYRFRDNVSYEDSITYQVTDTISDAARLAAVCYFIDTFEVALEVMGLKGRKVDFSSLFAKLIYATWVCFRIRMYKRGFLETVESNIPRRLKGKQSLVDILDKISDFFLFGILGLIWVDILKIKRGTGLSSLFAIGGAGTFTLTLACQDIARRALNGFALSASDAFYVGDQILLGDGTSGTVTSVGWLDTEIKGGDELITRIPNSQLSNIRISNRSRMKFSQVKQNLRFEYQDLDKIPTLVGEIKQEIEASCPKVVTDGSRPFRVRWTDFGDDCVEVLVDVRLRAPPVGEKYFVARQGVLEAIARAVKRVGVEIAIIPMIRRK